MALSSLKALLSPFPFKFLPSNAYEPFVNRVPQLVSLLLVQFFDFLFLNPMCPLVSEAMEHDLFGNGCAMPHGFGQLPVEFGSSAVRVSPTCTPAIDASGFNHVEMHTPITAFADSLGAWPAASCAGRTGAAAPERLSALRYPSIGLGEAKRQKPGRKKCAAGTRWAV
jgi:hypothetical protein